MKKRGALRQNLARGVKLAWEASKRRFVWAAAIALVSALLPPLALWLGKLAGRMAIVISHRFSTVRIADRIYVLEEGRVLESGTHDALVAARGRCAELFELQAAAYR